jgi:hypothetical protein
MHQNIASAYLPRIISVEGFVSLTKLMTLARYQLDRAESSAVQTLLNSSTLEVNIAIGLLCRNSAAERFGKVARSVSMSRKSKGNFGHPESSTVHSTITRRERHPNNAFPPLY